MKLISAGYFSKPHGLKGHLVLFTDFEIDEKINAVFIEKNGSQAPYFIEQFNPHPKGYLVKLEGINSVDEAVKFKNHEVFTEEKHLISEPDDEFELAGFKLIDKTRGEIGVIMGIDENNNNPLILVQCLEKQILLPYQELFITKIIKSKKELYYNAPDGLIDMYLEL